MKKLLFVFTLMLIISCNNENSKENKMNKLQESVSKALKDKMNNPDSFEFVSMTVSDTISVSERKELQTKERLDKVIELTKDVPNENLLNQTQMEYDYLKDLPASDDDAVYYVDFKARGENGFGATITKRYRATVLNDKNYTVTNLSGN